MTAPWVKTAQRVEGSPGATAPVKTGSSGIGCWLLFEFHIWTVVVNLTIPSAAVARQGEL